MDLRNYVPISIDLKQQQISWVHAPCIKFNTPFFRQEIQRIEKRELAIVYTPIDRIINSTNMAPEPAGIIFHTSRCGSTLVSNIIRRLSNAMVLSEPHTVSILSQPYHPDIWGVSTDGWEKYRDVLIRAMVGKYMQIAEGSVCYLKLVSWSLLVSEMFIQNFSCPMLFLYRQPEDVIVSNTNDQAGFLKLKQRPFLASLLLEIPAPNIMSMADEEFSAIVLGKFYKKIMKHLEMPGTMAIDYESLTVEKLCEIARHFAVPDRLILTESIMDEMNFYSKEAGKGTSFKNDTERKKESVTEKIRAFSNRYARNSYEALRLASSRSWLKTKT